MAHCHSERMKEAKVIRMVNQESYRFITGKYWIKKATKHFARGRKGISTFVVDFSIDLFDLSHALVDDSDYLKGTLFSYHSVGVEAFESKVKYVSISRGQLDLFLTRLDQGYYQFTALKMVYVKPLNLGVWPPDEPNALLSTPITDPLLQKLVMAERPESYISILNSCSYSPPGEAFGSYPVSHFTRRIPTSVN
ncbi:hypothetical protein O1611_g3043 [Lasiodiplodia mahajangana]|uniref:Uncharacterized protein n=1 Tax=Lasiodiplodia mahajangana TaxID=1108764 RepID=A0ACC2JTS3_9PEZI|nr:hypothetical protein O1611_g3043 [Lasiodiplodia mahajangana]